MSGIAKFNEEADLVHSVFPSLSKFERDGKTFIAGDIILADAGGNEIDRYTVEIHPVADYPNRFPHVFETGGRIPVNIEWHVFETDGHCCLMNLADELITCKAGITLTSFIEHQVKPYFFNQLHREKHGYFLKERSHGLKGELEFFFDLFGTSDITELYEMMRFVAMRKEPGRSENCFCGSIEKYRRCHREAFRTMSQFSNSEIRHFIKQIASTNEFRDLPPFLANELAKL
jgi:hypothetical protein